MKFISLLSSGIDSPVATYLISKKAEEIILLHADGRPFTDDRENKNFIKIAKHLKNLYQVKLEHILFHMGMFFHPTNKIVIINLHAFFVNE